jgi:hypothetical protein
MGTVASRLSGLNRVLKWDGENMEFTNIGPEDTIGIPKTIILNNENGNPRYKKEFVEVNALEYAKNLIKRTPRKGWELTV